MSELTSNLQAVIFDMDGVIVDSEPLWRDVMVEVFAEVGNPMTHEQCAETTGLTIEAVIDYHYEKKPWTGATKAETVRRIVERLIETIYQKAVPMPGLLEAISLFKSLGLKIGLSTSSSHNIIQAVLEKLEVQEVFDAINSAQDVVLGKPHPQVYLNTITDLQVDPTRCFAIEDSLNGLVSAKAARLKTIAVPEPKNWENPKFAIADIQLKSLNELTKDHLIYLESILT